MKRTRNLLLLAGASGVLSLCGCVTALDESSLEDELVEPVQPPGRVAVLDESNFQEFEYAQQGAEGFCPVLDVVYQATLTRQPDGSITFAASMIEEGEPGSANCRDVGDSSQPECIVVRELPKRTLTQQEVARVENTFGSMSVRWVPYGDRGGFDPCLVRTFRWDDSECNTLYGCVVESGRVLEVDPDDLVELLVLLEELAAASNGG
jgi:hypothetical protein